MLNKFMKNFKPNTPQPEKEDMENKEDTTALSAQVAEMSKVVQELQITMGAFAAQYSELKTSLQASEDAKVLMANQALANKMQAREKALVSAVGTDKATALMEATKSLDDSQFESIVSAMASNVVKEANSAFFKEVGVTVQSPAIEIADQDGVSRLAKLLDAEYKNQ